MRWKALLAMGGLLVVSSSAMAQASGASRAGGADATLAVVKKNFGDLSGWITKTADLVPADKYSYKPVATVRTFGQLLAHAIDGYAYYCAKAGGRNVEWSDATEKGALDKATLVRRLKEVTATCEAAHGGARDVAPLIENLGHGSLHYGNMITYLRMMGLTPPSS